MALDNMKDRAEVGAQITEKNKAQGEPGTKQPAHEDNRVDMESTVKTIDSMLEQVNGEPKKSSAERSKEAGNPNPVPPEERSLATQVGARTQQLDAAAGHLSAARTALTAQATSDAALLSDPRYERDLKVLELAQQGKLNQVTPSEFEKDTLAERFKEGTVPSTEEQVANDMQRLKEAENKNDGTTNSTDSQKTSTTSSTTIK